MTGFWQRARDFATGRKTETTTPALSQEGQALGFHWESETGRVLNDKRSALLWSEASQAPEPLGGVDFDHAGAEWTMNGEHHGIRSREEAMHLAEQDAAEWAIEPMAEASESYYATRAARGDREANMAGDFIIRDGDGKDTRTANLYAASLEGWPLADWKYEVDEATGFATQEEAQDELRHVAAEGGYKELNVVERETARLELEDARAKQREAKSHADGWFRKAGAAMLHSITGRGKAVEIKGSEPALTPEGKAQGFTWDRGEDANFSADLWHEGEFMAGVFDRYGTDTASVNVFGEGPSIGGKDLGGTYPTLEDGMKAAEEHTLHAMGAIDVQPLAEASESYYARLAALAESRGAETDVERDTGLEL